MLITFQPLFAPYNTFAYIHNTSFQLENVWEWNGHEIKILADLNLQGEIPMAHILLIFPKAEILLIFHKRPN